MKFQPGDVLKSPYLPSNRLHIVGVYSSLPSKRTYYKVYQTTLRYSEPREDYFRLTTSYVDLDLEYELDTEHMNRTKLDKDVDSILR